MSSPAAKIVVTGASGYIGKATIQHLIKLVTPSNVFVASRNPDSAAAEEFKKLVRCPVSVGRRRGDALVPRRSGRCVGAPRLVLGLRASPVVQEHCSWPRVLLLCLGRLLRRVPVVRRRAGWPQVESPLSWTLPPPPLPSVSSPGRERCEG
jgi:hypothetical protein